jgi:hypothetical protein
MVKIPNSKRQTSIKSPNIEKAQIEFYQKSNEIKSPTSKAKFKKPKFKMLNYNTEIQKKSKYRKNTN